jgi:hypothetical protein
MIDLKKAKLEDFEIIKARPRDPKKKVVCTYYRIKPENATPKRTDHRIVKLPDGFFNGHIQTGVHSIS